MSITLGDYFVETKKTVGALPAGSDNIIAETPCEDSINLATVQPVWKKIHEYTNSVPSTPFGGGFEITPTFFLLDDDVFADGYDYRVTINYSYTSPPFFENNYFSYTIGGNNWYHLMTGGTFTIVMNENNCGGSYANTVRSLLLEAKALAPFNLDYTVEIEQLIQATIEIDLCGGGTVIHLTELKEESDLITVYIDGLEPPVSVNSTNRLVSYDPSDLGFEELAKMPQTCLGYSVYYIGSLFSSTYSTPNEKTYYLDSGIYEAKINIPIVPPKALEFRLYDGVADYWTATSDTNGLVDWTALDGTVPAASFNMELQIWDGLIQETSSGEQYVYFKYDLSSYDCPCVDCGTDCGEINVIFEQSCGNSYGLKLNLMIQEGKYSIEGDTYTQGNEIIRPISKIKASYDFVISEYSDETYLLLMELISDNILIQVVDNIDTGNPTTNYYIDTELLTPSWNFNSKLGSLTIPVIKANSIKTKRRNCCN